MRHRATPRTRDIVGELRLLSALVEPYLRFASPAACREWMMLQALWPSDDDLHAGTTPLSDSDLQSMLAKVRRFMEILCSLAP
jgi:hypothetical protein